MAPVGMKRAPRPAMQWLRYLIRIYVALAISGVEKNGTAGDASLDVVIHS
jgi:hypothetical protein